MHTVNINYEIQQFIFNSYIITIITEVNYVASVLQVSIHDLLTTLTCLKNYMIKVYNIFAIWVKGYSLKSPLFFLLLS